MSTVAILNYDNYYNRRCLPPKNFVINPIPAAAGTNDYNDYVLEVFNNINFNPNDSVDTELIINWDGPVPNYVLETANYPIMLEGSRWWVISHTRTRSGQLKLQLHRDLIADNYLDITTAPAMIERGKLGSNDPYIINDEGLTFNKIKRSEELLKDETGLPWIVGYIAAPQAGETDTEVSYNVGQSFDYSGDSDTTWTYGQYVRQNGVKSSANLKYTHTIWAKESISAQGRYFTYGDQTGYVATQHPTTIGGIALKYPETVVSTTVFLDRLGRAFNEQFSSLNMAANSTLDYNNTLVNTLKSLEGKVVKIGADTFKRVRVVEQDFTYTVNAQPGTTYFDRMSQFITTPLTPTNPLFSGTPDADSFDLVITGKQYYLDLDTIYDEIRLTIPTTRNLLDDAPYSMFAIPYGTIGLSSPGFLSIGIGSEELATRVASLICEKLGTKVYDVQLLPFCPVRRAISSTTGLYLNNMTEGVDYTFIKHSASGTAINNGIMLWATSSEFTFDINKLAILPDDRKTVNQCYSYRLCSPNYSAIYEFNLAKNNGLQGFNVDCAYKPFSPYIHVYPTPAGGSLYGEDFNDPRGLICAGDFSMPATSDQWELYEINNKNYNNMFNRQIETMDLTHKIQRTESYVNATVGTIQGGVSGAGTAALMSGGNIYAAIAGGVGGAAASGVGAYFDIKHGEQLRANERDQAFDLFRMNNENIQAMPDTLTKVSAFNPNNKIFPVFEEYSATDTEIEAFKNYIKWYGMKVGRIDTIENFIWPTEEFVKASIIRFPETVAGDSYYINSINNELQKGVYLKQ